MSIAPISFPGTRRGPESPFPDRARSPQADRRHHLEAGPDRLLGPLLAGIGLFCALLGLRRPERRGAARIALFLDATCSC